MRLCVATPLYPPEPGGPATYAHILETELIRQGIDISLVKFRDVRRYPVFIRHIAYLIAVWKAGKRADVILALDPVSTGFPALLAAQLLKKPFIVKIVGDYAWEQGTQRFGITDTLDDFVRKGRVPFPVACLRAVQTHVAKGAKRVIVPSEYLKKIITAWGIKADKIDVIYNAMEAEATGKLPPAVEKITNPIIVTVGRLVPWKHVDGIIDAVAGLGSTSATLVVVGAGPEERALRERAAKYPELKIVFTGALLHADTLATIATADIFVLNSSYEGLSHLLIESLSLGISTIATSVGGNPELITHEENGLLVPAGDTTALTHAIERLLRDTEFAKSLGKAAAKSMERFSTQTMMARTEQLLNTLV